MKLIEITEATHGVRLDLRYATDDNITGRPLYRRPLCYLNVEGEALLRRAVELAAAQGWTIKIFDAFRPTEAQWRLWDCHPDPDFIADPRRGSPHSRGAAVDVTVLDADGAELDMGTGFDAFTPLSHHGAAGLGAVPARNRLLLLGLMTTAGWDFYRNEWWHYQLFDPRRFPLGGDSLLPNPMMAPRSALPYTARTATTSGM